MKKKYFVVLLIIAFIMILSWLFINRQVSYFMGDLAKNNDIEIIDSLAIDTSNTIFMYQNSQIISSSGDTKFIVIDKLASCSLKDRVILFQSGEIESFQSIKKDTIYVVSQSFISQKLNDSLYLKSIQKSKSDDASNKKLRVVSCQ